jgi:hypothetical protein
MGLNRGRYTAVTHLRFCNENRAISRITYLLTRPVGRDQAAEGYRQGRVACGGLSPRSSRIRENFIPLHRDEHEPPGRARRCFEGNHGTPDR